MSEEYPVLPTRETAGALLREILLQELTIGEGRIGQMDMLSILANAAEWLDGAVAKNATTGLTDAEQEAVNDMCEFAEDFLGDDDPNIIILRGLLDRTRASDGRHGISGRLPDGQ